MKIGRITRFWGTSFRFLHGCFGAGLVFIISPILLLLADSSPEGEAAYANIELGFSLLALAGASVCMVGLISTAYRLIESPFPTASLFVRFPVQPEPLAGETAGERARILPVVVPSLVLPTLIAGLGGWVTPAAHAPRVVARHSAA